MYLVFRHTKRKRLKPNTGRNNMTHFNDHLKLHKLVGMNIQEGCKIKMFRESGQIDSAAFNGGKWVDVLGDKVLYFKFND